jgi:hypothetical protein
MLCFVASGERNNADRAGSDENDVERKRSRADCRDWRTRYQKWNQCRSDTGDPLRQNNPNSKVNFSKVAGELRRSHEIKAPRLPRHEGFGKDN